MSEAARAAPSPAAIRLRLRPAVTAGQAAAAGVIALAAFLNFADLDREGLANSYYAGAVLSMAQSWHSFFFAAFDPGGFLAVDKPALGLWPQTLEAYLVVPGLGLAYLVGAGSRLRTRLLHLALAAWVMISVSLAWVLAVDLTPSSLRPLVTDSGTNSEISLLLGYNGLGRLTSGQLTRLPSVPLLHLNVDLSIVPAFSPGIGSPGSRARALPLRYWRRPPGPAPTPSGSRRGRSGRR